MQDLLLMAHGLQGDIHRLVREGGGRGVLRAGEVIQEGVAVREALRDVDRADEGRDPGGFRFILLCKDKGNGEILLHLLPGGLVPLRGIVLRDDGEALIGQDVDLAGEGAVHPLREDDGQLVDGGGPGGHGGCADIIHVQGHNPVRRPALLQAADGGDKGVAVIAHGGLEKVIGLVFKGDEEEKQAQGGDEIADDIAGENHLEGMRAEIDHGIPENGDLLVMVEALAADEVENEAGQDLRIGDGVKNGMKDAPVIDQALVKVGDPPCDGRSEDEECFQQMNGKEENPHRDFELRDLRQVVGIEQENAGQQVVEPQIGQVHRVAHKGGELLRVRDGVDGNDIQRGADQVDHDHTEKEPVMRRVVIPLQEIQREKHHGAHHRGDTEFAHVLHETPLPPDKQKNKNPCLLFIRRVGLSRVGSMCKKSGHWGNELRGAPVGHSPKSGHWGHISPQCPPFVPPLSERNSLLQYTGPVLPAMQEADNIDPFFLF